jgi:FkbM family methyltransferase
MKFHGAVNMIGKGIYFFLVDRWYRYVTIKSLYLFSKPRNKSGSLRFLGKTLRFVDLPSCLFSIQEIFFDRIYQFKVDQNDPVIVDVGSNIGISIIYFKTIFPESKIFCFEADPKVFQVLEKNISSFDFRDVILFNKAAWTLDTSIGFNEDGSDGGSIDESNSKNLIEAIDFAKFLNSMERIHFLKIDIEGAEKFVFPHCRFYLKNILYIFVEYHSKPNEPQNIDLILSIFKEEGFRVQINSVKNTRSPFIDKEKPEQFDLQLNIFAENIRMKNSVNKI